MMAPCTSPKVAGKVTTKCCWGVEKYHYMRNLFAKQAREHEKAELSQVFLGPYPHYKHRCRDRDRQLVVFTGYEPLVSVPLGAADFS
jgi:hypothetical protein